MNAQKVVRGCIWFLAVTFAYLLIMLALSAMEAM